MSWLNWMTIMGCLLAFCACKGDDAPAVKRAGTPCEKLLALTEAVGCSEMGECDVEEACTPAAIALADCLADDVSQCSCESDGADLNCENAPSCRGEQQALARCQGDE